MDLHDLFLLLTISCSVIGLCTLIMTFLVKSKIIEAIGVGFGAAGVIMFAAVAMGLVTFNQHSIHTPIVTPISPECRLLQKHESSSDSSADVAYKFDCDQDIYTVSIHAGWKR